MAYGGPFVMFMLAGWYGLAQVVQNKRDLRVSPQAHLTTRDVLATGHEGVTTCRFMLLLL